MRHHHVWLFVVALLLVAGLVPVQAQGLVPVGNTVSTAVSFFIYADSKTSVPMGRLSIWFAKDSAGEPTFRYEGSSKTIHLPSGLPAFAWCFARVELFGAYETQQVKSTWKPACYKGFPNVFATQVGVDETLPRFWFFGKEKSYLKISFIIGTISIGTGSRDVQRDEYFELIPDDVSKTLCGLNDYFIELASAKRSWPCLTPEYQELWATLSVMETWYAAQGTRPSVLLSTARLRTEFIARQEAADAAEAKANAEAAARAREEARQRQVEADRKQREDKAARDAAELARPQPWSLVMTSQSTVGWDVWLDGGQRTFVPGNVVTFTTKLGDHCLEVVPHGAAFGGWHHCNIVQPGQQVSEKEVR